MSLESWNDTPAKQAILDFVAAASADGGPGYIPPAERIAAFDNDGTHWSSSRRPQDRSTWSCVSTGPKRRPSTAPGRRRRSSRATENVLENFLKEKKWLP
jgi:hypothetical protein